MLCGCAGFHSYDLSNGTKMLICCSPSSSWCHTTHRHFGSFCIVQLFIFSTVVSATFAPSACVMSSHRVSPALHPSVFLLWLLPPSLLRSTEQRARRSRAIRARPAVPPPSPVPLQTPPHRPAGRQRQVNAQSIAGLTCSRLEKEVSRNSD